jgi:hypothetical protein
MSIRKIIVERRYIGEVQVETTMTENKYRAMRYMISDVRRYVNSRPEYASNSSMPYSGMIRASYSLINTLMRLDLICENGHEPTR